MRTLVANRADAAPHARSPAARRARRLAALAALALAGLLAALTRLSIAGHWYGVYLLRARDGVGLELKDDLFLGDGSRLILGIPFKPIRTALAGEPRRPGVRLELEWDAREGSGLVRSHLGGGTELVTVFARYEDSLGKTPQGLFVGGALPDVAADPRAQNESGMTYRDGRGWHHVWCNVNEAIWVEDPSRLSYPGQWRFLGSRVLIQEVDRIVLESSHEISEGGRLLRMDRYAYFRAGLPFFKLGIRVSNAGDQTARYGYVYGDEPWVGEFGSAAGNVGWLAGGLVNAEGFFDPRANRWAGILDHDTGIADFIAWVGDELPEDAYFSNRPGRVEPGAPPLTSNEIFIGLEWAERVIAPGESRSMLLAIGMAARDPASGAPALPAGVDPRP